MILLQSEAFQKTILDKSGLALFLLFTSQPSSEEVLTRRSIQSQTISKLP